MKAKRYVGILVVLTITTSAFAVAGIPGVYPSISQILFPSETSASATARAKTSEKTQPAVIAGETATAGGDDVPDKVVYFVLFSHLIKLKNEAEKMAARGENLNYRKLYEDQAALDTTQGDVLFQTAQECIDAIKPIDAEAKQIITKARGTGEMKSPAELPQPPRELNALQTRKDDVILRFRNVLQDRLGAEKYAEFDRFARKKIVPNVTRELNGGDVK